MRPVATSCKSAMRSASLPAKRWKRRKAACGLSMEKPALCRRFRPFWTRLLSSQKPDEANKCRLLCEEAVWDCCGIGLGLCAGCGVTVRADGGVGELHAANKLPLPKTAAWRSKWRRDTRNVITSSKANSRDYNAFKQPAICVLLDLTNLQATPNALHARHWPKSARESRHHRQTAPPRANAGVARHCPNWPN